MFENLKVHPMISTSYRIRPTQYTNELAEKYGADLTADGVTFEGAPKGGKIRGYIRLPLFGMASILKGPEYMSVEDLEL